MTMLDVDSSPRIGVVDRHGVHKRTRRKIIAATIGIQNLQVGLSVKCTACSALSLNPDCARTPCTVPLTDMHYCHWRPVDAPLVSLEARGCTTSVTGGPWMHH